MRSISLVFHENDGAWDAARRLFENGCAGAPVVDAEGRLSGVISQADLAAYMREHSYRAPDFYAEPEHDPVAARSAATVGDLMSRVIIEVREDARLDDVERHMLRRRVHRVLVMRDGSVRGVITTTDLLRARSS